MANIELIDFDNWENLINELPHELLDIYFTPAYSILYEQGTREGLVRCIKFERNGDLALYPFIERLIPLELTEGKILKDIATPYGYGGPISITKSTEFLKNFNDALDEFFYYSGYISEFIRFHPLLNNYRFRNCDVIFVHNTFGIDFSAEPFDIKDFWKESLFRGLRKSQKNGLLVNIEKLDFQNIQTFKQLYFLTMERKKANKYYFFSDDYWNLLLNLSKKHEVIYIGVSYLGDTIAAAIFLTWQDFYVHYHLGASNSKFLNLYPNNLLFASIQSWAREKKYKFMHLGGGINKGDSLERFKRSISNTSFEFYVGRKIFRNEIYHELCDKAKKISPLKFSEDFFPSYRSIYR
ncbi:MAG: GNAT family N-acetyltransferase [Nitrososphaeria archaeon]|nr:GNAT family N-acetyltransferase [Candidatus Jingweiarchaeum tengchongense]